jgi:hypothetical protein
MCCAARAVAAEPATVPDVRDTLAELWSGMYDMSEEFIAGGPGASPLVPLTGLERVQVNVRRIPLPWLGSHVLYVEEYLYDEPFERRRRVLLNLEPPDADGTVRVRQYTRKIEATSGGQPTADDVESIEGCDIWLKREGEQFRGGTRDHQCLEHRAREPQWIDYRVVIGESLFWYRKRTLTVANDDLVEEVAGFPHVVGDARLFNCSISWVSPAAKSSRRALDDVELHDRGGRARFRTPDGRELQLELHGRDWPLSAGRESLVLILNSGNAAESPLASSWTTLDAARVGIDIGWLAVDCAPVVTETGEEPS